MDTFPQKAIDRFWDRVDKQRDGCWRWIMGPTNSGYGLMYVRYLGKRTSQMLSAHRFSYQLHYGPIPKGMSVLHRCDVKLCVNPGHLYLGTARDNARDAQQRGQKKIGEDVSWAKLTAIQVRMARILYDAGVCSNKELAAKYGLTTGGMYTALSGRSWKGMRA
jgi:hypothetical protein